MMRLIKYQTASWFLRRAAIRQGGISFFQRRDTALMPTPTLPTDLVGLAHTPA